MKRIGIMGAMPEEIDYILRSATVLDREEAGLRTYVRARIAGHEAVVVFSRWGKVAAAVAATTLLQRFGAERILFTGVAGSAADEVAVGDVVVGSRLVQHDMDASAVPGLSRYEIPLLGVTQFSADAALTALAERAVSKFLAEEYAAAISGEERALFGISRPRGHAGLIASGDRFIAEAARMRELREGLPGVLCVEMEGAAVAQVCHEHGVPFAVIRTISDKADDHAPRDFVRFVQRVAAPLTGGVILSLLQSLDREG